MNVYLQIVVTQGTMKLLSVDINSNGGDQEQGVSAADIQFAADVSRVAGEAITAYLGNLSLDPITDPHIGEGQIPVPTPVPPIYQTMKSRGENA